MPQVRDYIKVSISTIDCTHRRSSAVGEERVLHHKIDTVKRNQVRETSSNGELFMKDVVKMIGRLIRDKRAT